MGANNAIPPSPRGSLGDGTCDYSPQPSPQSSNYVVTSGMNDMHAASVFYSSAGMLSMNNQVPSSASPSIYSKSVISSAPSAYHQQQQQMQGAPIHSPAPLTPTSIPDIILTGKSHMPHLNSRIEGLPIFHDYQTPTLKKVFSGKISRRTSVRPWLTCQISTPANFSLRMPSKVICPLTR